MIELNGLVFDWGNDGCFVHEHHRIGEAGNLMMVAIQCLDQGRWPKRYFEIFPEGEVSDEHIKRVMKNGSKWPEWWVKK